MRAEGRAHRDLAGPALIAVEVLGLLLLFAPIPLALMWAGAYVYRLTGSLLADLSFALLAFVAAACAMIAGLSRLDERWIEHRRRLGHEQRDGALTRVVVIAIGIALPAAYIWFNVSGAVVIKFMPHT